MQRYNEFIFSLSLFHFYLGSMINFTRTVPFTVYSKHVDSESYFTV